MPARTWKTSSGWRSRPTRSAMLCGSPLVLKWGKFGSFFACSAYDKKKPDSCTFTKENFAAKPNLPCPEEKKPSRGGILRKLRPRHGAQSGPSGSFMACPGYNEDPPCKTTASSTRSSSKSRRSRSTRSAPNAASSWCCATASMENSSPAPAIPNASTSSRTSSE